MNDKVKIFKSIFPYYDKFCVTITQSNIDWFNERKEYQNRIEYWNNLIKKLEDFKSNGGIISYNRIPYISENEIHIEKHFFSEEVAIGMYFNTEQEITDKDPILTFKKMVDSLRK